MKLTYYGHSCFGIESDDFTIVIDPYAPGSVPGLDELHLEANLVLCSHSHADHSYTQAVQRKFKEYNPFRITQLKCYHDNENGKLRGTNIIHIIENENIRIAHFGDIGHIPNEELIREIGGIDIALLPVGGHYTVDAETAYHIVESLHPHTVIPMHYRTKSSGYSEISDVSSFIQCFTDVKETSSELEINKELPKVVLMKQKMAK